MDVLQSPEEAEIKQEGSAAKPKQRSRIRKTPGGGSDETSKRRIVVSSACVGMLGSMIACIYAVLTLRF